MTLHGGLAKIAVVGLVCASYVINPSKAFSCGVQDVVTGGIWVSLSFPHMQCLERFR